LAGKVAQGSLNVRLADPGQPAVGAGHAVQGIDDDLQRRGDGSGVGVGEQVACRSREDTALAASAAVEFGFLAAADAVDVEGDAAAAPACGLVVDDAG
jgi:hypothetical protein